MHSRLSASQSTRRYVQDCLYMIGESWIRSCLNLVLWPASFCRGNHSPCETGSWQQVWCCYALSCGPSDMRWNAAGWIILPEPSCLPPPWQEQWHLLDRYLAFVTAYAKIALDHVVSIHCCCKVSVCNSSKSRKQVAICHSSQISAMTFNSLLCWLMRCMQKPNNQTSNRESWRYLRRVLS